VGLGNNLKERARQTVEKFPSLRRTPSGLSMLGKGVTSMYQGISGEKGALYPKKKEKVVR